MAVTLDNIDRKILMELQHDASQSLDDIAKKVGASKTPVWNRLKRLKDEGIIRREVAIVDPDKVGLEACFFVLVRTSEHDAEWQARFLSALTRRNEVIEAHRALMGLNEDNHAAFHSLVMTLEAQ